MTHIGAAQDTEYYNYENYVYLEGASDFPHSYDINVKDDYMLHHLALDDGGGAYGHTLQVNLYLNSNQFFQEQYTFNQPCQVVQLDRDDYNQLPVNGDTITVEIEFVSSSGDSANDQIQITDSSVSYDGSAFGFSNQRPNTANYGCPNQGVTNAIGFKEYNFPPTIDSSSVIPDPPLLGENVSYGATVSDSDGQVSYTNLTVERTNQTGSLQVLRDGFEDGDYTSDPVWDEVATAGSISVSNSVSKEGSNSLELSGDAAVYHDRGSEEIEDGDVYSTWIRQSATDDFIGFGLTNDNSDGGLFGSDAINMYMTGSGDWRFQTRDNSGSVIGSVSGSSYSASTWYEVVITVYPSNSSADAVVKDVSGNTVFDPSALGISDNAQQYVMLSESGNSGSSGFFDLPTHKYSQVQPLTVVEDVQRTGTSPSWNDLFTVQSGWAGGWLNATLEVVDDEGAVTTAQLDRLLTDTAPSVSLSNPVNQTYWKYGVPVEFSVSDSDSNAGEEYSCSISKDGSSVETVVLVEDSNASYSTTVRSDLGAHNLNVSCTDPAGNTGAESVDYTVKAFELQSTSSDDSVFESENVSYTVQVKLGEMVDSLDSSLVWGGSSETSRTIEKGGSGAVTYTVEHFFRPPVVENNATDFNWSFDYTANYEGIDGSSQSETRSSEDKSQTVKHAFYSPEISLDKDRVIEKEDFEATLSWIQEVSDSPADLDPFISFNGSTYETSQRMMDSPLLSNKSRTMDVTGDLTVSFKGESRDIEASEDSIDVHKKILTRCNAESASQTTALRLTVFNEENRTENIEAQIDYNLDITHHGEHTRNYAFNRSGETVETCIYPSWAEYRMSGPIQYFADGYTDRNYNVYNVSISNQTEEINLYILPTDFSTPVYYQVSGPEGPLEGVTIKTMRYFVDRNSYLTISKSETDSEGVATTYQRINEIYYKYLITRDGETLLETDRQILTCTETPCTKEFKLNPNTVSPYFQVKRGFSYDCRLNDGENASLQCTVNHDSGTMQKANLFVEERQTIGKETQCDITTVDTGSSMVCELGNLSDHRYSYELFAWKDGEKFDLDFGTVNRVPGLYGNDDNALLISFMLVLSSAALGRYSPGAGITWMSLGLAGVTMAGIFSISITMATALIAISVIGFLEVRY